jgi:hypothetical protein
LTTSAPAPGTLKDSASGAMGKWNLCQAMPKLARPGTSRMAASAFPTRDRAAVLQPKASRIKRLTEASSRKSIESANSETDPIERATANSIPK